MSSTNSETVKLGSTMLTIPIVIGAMSVQSTSARFSPGTRRLAGPSNNPGGAALTTALCSP